MTTRTRLRMLITTDSFLPRWDGISRFLAEVIPSLAQEYDLTIVAPDFGNPSPHFDAKLVRFPVYAWRVGDINLARASRSKIKKLVEDSDVIFNQTLGPIGIHALLCARRADKPVIAFIHSIDWELFSKGIKYGKSLVRVATIAYQRWLYNGCKKLLVSSSTVARTFQNEGIKTPKSVVRLGVNIAKFHPAPSKEKAKRDIGLNPRHTIIGYSGRIGREKDLGTLKRAFDQVHPDFHNSRLLIVGAGVPSEEKKLAGDHVIMAGSIDNVVPYLQAMDIFVLPSLTETSSLATMEAMACGLPVVATPVGSIKEYVQPGVNGYLFHKRNSKALAARLSELLSDPTLRGKIGKAARQTAIKEFRWFETSREIKRAVNEVMKEPEEE